MEEIEYRRLARIESDHWWYQSVHSLVLGFIKKGPGQLILDAGCGTGGLIRKLLGYGKVVGLDISLLALSLAKNKNATYINGSVNKLPFKKDNFNVVASISVLYHQRVDDAMAADEMNRVLKKDGLAIVVLPAFAWLFSNYDRVVHTKKRYNLREVEKLMGGSGFNIIDSRYLFGSVFPIFVAKRTLERCGLISDSVSDLLEFPKWLNCFLICMCKIEWIIGKYIKFPFGSSLVVVARKK